MTDWKFFFISLTLLEVVLGVFAYEAYRARFRKLSLHFVFLIVMICLLQMVLA